MATDINKVIVCGRLTRDPEIRAAGQSQVCRFSLAVGRSMTVNGERKEETSFFDCVAWGRQAEIINQYCQKGKQLLVDGRLRQNTWDSPEGKRSRVEIVVENFQLLGGNQSGQGSGYADQDHQPPQRQAPQQHRGFAGPPVGGDYGQGGPPSQSNPMSYGDTPFSGDDIPF